MRDGSSGERETYKHRQQKEQSLNAPSLLFSRLPSIAFFRFTSHYYTPHHPPTQTQATPCHSPYPSFSPSTSRYPTLTSRFFVVTLTLVTSTLPSSEVLCTCVPPQGQPPPATDTTRTSVFFWSLGLGYGCGWVEVGMIKERDGFEKREAANRAHATISLPHTNYGTE